MRRPAGTLFSVALFSAENVFYREAYRQRRGYFAKDGKVEDAFDDF